MILPCSVQTNLHGEELREHGTRLFPVAFYLDQLPRDEIPWHWHNELEFGLVVEGSVIVETASEKYTLQKGEGFFVNSNVLHAAFSPENVSCDIHSVVCHPRAVSGSTDNIVWQKYLKPLMENQSCTGFYLTSKIDWQKRILDAVSFMWQEAEQETYGFEMKIRNELSTIILILSKYQPVMKKKSYGKEQRDNVRIKEMLTYIQDNYNKEVTIEDIASSCAISTSECIRCFRSTINTTPIAYLKSYRLQQAALKLQLTNDKISSIAESCGFQEMSYFSKSFRETYGCTPSEYRIGNFNSKLSKKRSRMEEKYG